jgi:hypothetical protein
MAFRVESMASELDQNGYKGHEGHLKKSEKFLLHSVRDHGIVLNCQRGCEALWGCWHNLEDNTKKAFG